MATEEKQEQQEQKEQPEEAKPTGPPKSTFREYFESFTVTLVLALFGMTFIIQATPNRRSSTTKRGRQRWMVAGLGGSVRKRRQVKTIAA